jgi:hypothetical protein
MIVTSTMMNDGLHFALLQSCAYYQVPPQLVPAARTHIHQGQTRFQPRRGMMD